MAWVSTQDRLPKPMTIVLGWGIPATYDHSIYDDLPKEEHWPMLCFLDGVNGWYEFPDLCEPLLIYWWFPIVSPDGKERSVYNR